MIPFSHERDFSYMEKVERQAQIARAEHASQLAGGVYLMARAAVRALVRLVKPANDDAAGPRAA
jgi:hypothetical protein